MDIGKTMSTTNIYNVPGSQGEQMEGNTINESRQNDVEKKFVTATVELVIEALDIGWNDRRIVQSLLTKALSEPMDKRYREEGLLQQFEAYVLELSGERIKKELEVPAEVKINHSHATHAKYADIVDYLKAEDKEAWLEKFNKSKKTG
jgi:hypothetical protein